MDINLMQGDCLERMKEFDDNSVDSIVTDPPYGLSFMGKHWDKGVPSAEIWAEALRVLKPGGHLLAFAGTRTQHRMAVNIEDAGFEIRDMIAWVYGSGFPKSLNVSKAIDKMDAAEAQQARRYRFTEWVRSQGVTSKQIDEATGTNMGGHYTTAASQPAVATREHFEKLRPFFCCDVPEWVERLVDERTVESENFKQREVLATETRYNEASGIVSAGRDERKQIERKITAPATEAAKQWDGWGTALKPALEPITVARKPFKGTVAANVLENGTGAINIDGCRVGDFQNTTPSGVDRRNAKLAELGYRPSEYQMGEKVPDTPPGRWPANLIHDGSDEVVGFFPESKGQQGAVTGSEASSKTANAYGDFSARSPSKPRADKGSAARFFYCAKASKKDRGADNNHPTVKPTDLMRYLCRLVTPPNGIVLDPFMGSGSTGKAAVLEGFSFVGIELESESFDIAKQRINEAHK